MDESRCSRVAMVFSFIRNVVGGVVCSGGDGGHGYHDAGHDSQDDGSHGAAAGLGVGVVAGLGVEADSTDEEQRETRGGGDTDGRPEARATMASSTRSTAAKIIMNGTFRYSVEGLFDEVAQHEGVGCLAQGTALVD